MRKEIRELHHTLVDLVGLMNRPQRDSALLEEAGVSLDRALFPLLIVIERKGPIGVVELAELVGRDYTTVSRQISKLDGLGLIERYASKTDSRVREAVITSKGKEMTRAIDAARERLAAVLFADWTKRDLEDLARLMRRFADDLQALPMHGPSSTGLAAKTGVPKAAPQNQQLAARRHQYKKAPSI
jgi:DNA-binding MarR family transcriptional regulator